jgi:hypothetical protein
MRNMEMFREIVGLAVAVAGVGALAYSIAYYNPAQRGWDFFRDGIF